MTWKEFKNIVDKKLARRKMSDDITIDFFDCQPFSSKDITVHIDKKDNTLTITD